MSSPLAPSVAMKAKASGTPAKFAATLLKVVAISWTTGRRDDTIACLGPAPAGQPIRWLVVLVQSARRSVGAGSPVAIGAVDDGCPVERTMRAHEPRSGAHGRSPSERPDGHLCRGLLERADV